jgi:hypothetical protein
VPEEGHGIGMRHKAYALEIEGDEPLAIERMTSFTRSTDPCTSIVTTLRRRKSLEVARSSRHRGWANSGNREEPTPRSERTDGARLAACPRSRKGGSSGTSRKGRRLRSPSLRGSRAPVGLPARRKRRLQKSIGTVRPRISSAHALQKEWSGSSERGPSRGGRRRDERRRARRANRR